MKKTAATMRQALAAMEPPVDFVSIVLTVPTTSW